MFILSIHVNSLYIIILTYWCSHFIQPGLLFNGEGNGNPPQCSSLENPMDRGDWQATVHGVTRVGYDLATKPPPPWLTET